ncbi:hypothetical protein [Amycolatopsis sp. 195334CR]|uniref:hypothetical protein n=1 Tax=Amycolatopsis sp. 195334CR TaxID=2814588 RepID=UPI001A8F22E7|nr:hypothetical protein [Amycolatopsis sp. 195334CR]MBN6034093.1 hypothetical protein [Amycolatopsis sp. 195334CR]
MGSTITLQPGRPEQIVVRAADGQYRLETAPIDLQDPWPQTTDGLTTGEDDWFVVLTGLEWGPLNLTVEYLADPATAPTDEWEVVSQRTIHIVNSTLVLLTTSLDVLHTFTLPTSGWHQTQIAARGRASRLAEGHNPGGLERHHLQLWPTPAPAAPTLLRGPDEYGRNFLPDS